MLLSEIVLASAEVGATTKRTVKIARLAVLLASTDENEVEIVVGFLVGWPRQGRIGVGWATLATVLGGHEPAVDATVTVAEVDALLTSVGTISGGGSQAARHGELAAVLDRTTAAEADFLFRLLTGELRHGANEGVVTEAVAHAENVPPASVRRAAMFLGDLGRAAALARKGGVDALDAVGLQVLTAVQPMLAATSPDVGTALLDAGGMASVEWKLDGARVQVHRLGDEVRVFTRNLNEISERLPAVVAAARSLPVTSVVLDGEALGIDPSGRPQLFQHTMSRFGAEGEGAAAGLQPFFFDVLHVDGVDLVDAPLAERLAVLERIAGPWRVPAITTADPHDAARFAEDSLAAGHEGVMVKAIDSRYEAGRRGNSWRKVKPVRTLDLVVLAAEWGHGRRTGWLSNLHLGARGSGAGQEGARGSGAGQEGARGSGASELGGDEPKGEPTFVMVGKTFKGLTDELLRWQTARLQELAVSDDGHVVWVRPELVVEIAVDGVQVSRRYPGGVALRFARVRGYRPDRTPNDADTIDAVRALLL